MSIEIERKFLLGSDIWRREVTSSRHLLQGYCDVAPGGRLSTLRVRIIDDSAAVLTMKGRQCGLSRSEFEFPIPAEQARELIAQFCGTRVVEKIRHLVPAAEGTWEIDEFLGANAGLFTAELELPAEDAPFVRPSWLGPEVSGDSRYNNGSLSRHPYSSWNAAPDAADDKMETL